MKKFLGIFSVVSVCLTFIISTYVLIDTEFKKIDIEKNQQILFLALQAGKYLDYEQKKEIIHNIRIGDGGYFYLTRRSDGTDVIHPNPSKEGKSYWENKERVHTPSLDALVKKIQTGETGYDYYISTDLNNNVIKKITVFSASDEEHTFGLTIPVTPINKRLLSMLVTNLIFGALMILGMQYYLRHDK